MRGVTADRRVHAFRGQVEIVRYELAGKWYREIPGLPRILLTVDEAAREATQHGFTWREGITGGSRFDALVRARQQQNP